MINQTQTMPNLNYARAAGAAYLGVVLFGGFAEFFVRMQLHVSGDITQTVSNIRSSEFLFRMGLLADLSMLFLDVLLALFLFKLFKDVNWELSVLALVLSLLRVPLLAANLSNHYEVLQILNNVDYLALFETEQINAMATLALEKHQKGYLIAQMLFGTWCFTVGILVYASNFIPRFLGVLMMLAGFGYLTDLVMSILFPTSLSPIPDILLTESAFAEISLCLWLLLMGGRVQIRALAEARSKAERRASIYTSEREVM